MPQPRGDRAMRAAVVVAVVAEAVTVRHGERTETEERGGEGRVPPDADAATKAAATAAAHGRLDESVLQGRLFAVITPLVVVSIVVMVVMVVVVVIVIIVTVLVRRQAIGAAEVELRPVVIGTPLALVAAPRLDRTPARLAARAAFGGGDRAAPLAILDRLRHHDAERVRLERVVAPGRQRHAIAEQQAPAEP